MTELKESLRERRKGETKRDLAALGMKLFLSQGFEVTTIDEIVDPLGVSKRTFFRYFKNKEDIVFAWWEELTDEIVGALTEQRTDESPFRAVCKALCVLLRYYDQDKAWAVAMMRLSGETPALLGRSFEKRLLWEKALTKELTPRMPGSSKTASMRARITVGAAMSAFQIGVDEWFLAGGTSDIRKYIEPAFDIVEDIGTLNRKI